ncbi:MAG TPA: PaaI family thioesterase [Bacteroidales bacterium]|nr:PaaI family thioesterase [Bacteroidales bacterium]HPJ60896.1 PaaI family thioesterase [Bacteroidales bacterium]HPR13661.1 PaaI family thioesterase [Bacteroidales bacterium]
MKQIREIKNPFDADQNMCFGCGPKNQAGLKLSFREDDEKLYASWDPLPEYQGYINVLHGGIIATLLDEAGAWCIYLKAGTTGVTSVMTVRYLKPVHISKGKITVEARLLNREKTKALIAASLYDGEGKLCAEADIDYFIYPEAIARKRYYYPGKEAFYFPDKQDILP